MSKVGGLGVGVLFTVILNRLIVFKYIRRNNLPPYQKVGGFKQVLCLCQ